jgi:DivIVA domain-containing protein
MDQAIRITVKDILEKNFKMSLKGYNPDEVDKFLDDIIQDYEVFEQKIESMENEIQQLKKDKRNLSTQESRPSQPVGVTNYDLLQRISNLEKEVFGRKLND